MKPSALFRSCLVHAVASAILAAPALCAEKMSTYSNKEFGFSVQYPASWAITPSSTPNLRVKLVAPANAPAAECAVVVKRYPNAVSAQQSDIDQVFVEPPTTAELEELLSQGGYIVKVARASAGRLGSRPAHLARFQYRRDGNVYASGQAALTATPGLTWSVSCYAQGDNPKQAEKNFHSWEEKIVKFFESFQFK